MASRLFTALRDGTWLTAERIRVYPLIVLVMSVLALGHMLAMSDGLNAADGQPIGTDFSNVYAAGELVLEGRAADAYDWTAHHDVEQAVFGPATPYYGWHYPPMFLAVAALLALMPYLAALAAWQGATLPLYLLSIAGIVRTAPDGAARPGPDFGRFWAVLAFPAVFINIAHGHNGFLTAGLFGFGLLLLDRRPVLAGLLLGALCYKPQFGLLVPLALVAGGRWRAIAAAAAAVLGLSAAATALFGPDVWRAFADSLALTRSVVLEQGATGWHKIQTVFAAARALGAGVELAYGLQAIVTASVAACVVLVWRSRAAFEWKAAVLLSGSLLATPYSLDYDMVVLGPALAFLAARGLRDGFRPYERSLLALVWITPLVARMTMWATGVPLGTLVLLVLFAFAAAAGLGGIADLGRRGREPAFGAAGPAGPPSRY